jgi:hypothetical protein
VSVDAGGERVCWVRDLVWALAHASRGMYGSAAEICVSVWVCMDCRGGCSLWICARRGGISARRCAIEGTEGGKVHARMRGKGRAHPPLGGTHSPNPQPQPSPSCPTPLHLRPCLRLSSPSSLKAPVTPNL